MRLAAPAKSAGGWKSVLPVAVLLLVTVAWTLPFLQPHHRYPLTSFVSDWIALVAGLASFLLVLAYARHGELQVPAVTAAPLVLALLVAIHTLSGSVPYPETGWIAVLYLLWAACCAVTGRWLAAKGARWSADWLATGLLAGAVLAAVGGLLQMYEVHSFLDPVIVAKKGRPFGNLGQGNHLAQYLAMGLVSLAYLRARHRIGTVAGLALLAPLLVTFAATGSRACLLYLVAMLSVGGWYHARAKSAESRTALLWLAGAVFGYALLVVVDRLAFSAFGAASSAPVAASLERIAGDSGSGEVRWGFWRHALAVFLDHPVTGSGWGTYSWEMFQRNGGQWWLGPNHTANAHNLVAQIGAETGLAGLAAVLVPAAFWVRRVTMGAAGTCKAWAVGVVALLAVFSMVEFPLWYAYFLGIGALLSGWLDPRTRVVRVTPLLAWAGSALVVLGIWLCAVAWNDNRVLELAIDGRALEQPGVAPMLVREMARMEQSSLLRPELEQIYAPTLLGGGRAIAGAVVDSERATRFAPTPSNVYRHAVLLHLGGRESEANALFAHALRAFAAVPNSRSAAREALETGDRVRPGSMDQLRRQLHPVVP